MIRAANCQHPDYTEPNYRASPPGRGGIFYMLYMLLSHSTKVLLDFLPVCGIMGMEVRKWTGQPLRPLPTPCPLCVYSVPTALLPLTLAGCRSMRSDIALTMAVATSWPWAPARRRRLRFRTGTPLAVAILPVMLSRYGVGTQPILLRSSIMLAEVVY